MTRLNRADPAPQPGVNPSRVKQAREWKNVGPRAVHDLKPEETGVLFLTEGESQALIEAGYLLPTEGVRDEDPQLPFEEN